MATEPEPEEAEGTTGPEVEAIELDPEPEEAGATEPEAAVREAADETSQSISWPVCARRARRRNEERALQAWLQSVARQCERRPAS